MLTGVIISMAAFAHWFSGGYYLNYVDALVPVDFNSLNRLIYNLDPQVFPWNAESNWSWIIYWLMLVIPSRLFHSLSLSQMLLYIFVAVSSVTGFYLLSNYLLDKFKVNISLNTKKFLSFIFALIYTFNLYTFYYGFFMFNPDIFIVAFLPLNLLSLFRIFPLEGEAHKTNTVWTAAFFVSLLLMDAGFLTYIFFAEYAVWIALYFLVYLYPFIKAIRFKKIVPSVLFLFLVFLSQWWWFLPALNNFSNLYSYQSSLGTTRYFLGQPAPSNLLNSFRILGIPLMAGNPFSWNVFYTDNRVFTFPLFILLFLLLVSVRGTGRLHRKKILIYLFMMLLVSLFLIKYNNPPFAGLMEFAFKYIPFFGAFRDAFHKAGPYFILPLVVLSCLGAGILMSSVKNRILKVCFWLIIVLAGVVFTGPFFLFMGDNIRTYYFYSNNQKYQISAKTRIPPEYYDLKNKLEPGCRGKIVLVVPKGGWMSSAVWPKYGDSYMALDLLKQTINCTFINSFAFNPRAEAITEAPYILMQKGDYQSLKQFLTKNQIQYILIRNDNIPNSFTNWLYVDPVVLAQKLDLDPDYEKNIINEYFTVYRLNSLNFPNSFGFGLSASGVYTSAPLDIPADYLVLSRSTPDIIGQPVFNTPAGPELYNNVGTFISQGICSECRRSDEIGRLTLGSAKKIKYNLDIVKDGKYRCDGQVFADGFEITGHQLFDGKGNLSGKAYPQMFSVGRYFAEVNYKAPQELKQDLLILNSGEIREFPLTSLNHRNYRLGFSAENSGSGAELILAKRKLSPEELKQQQTDPAATVFTIPVGVSDEIQDFSRVIQLDEFNIQPYHLYIRVLPRDTPTKAHVIFRNLIFERNIDANLVAFSCAMSDGIVTKDTEKLQVTQINPLNYKLILPPDFHSGYLTFNKGYSPGWEAYSVQSGKKQVLPHFQNAYANGWFVENFSGGEIIVYQKQQQVFILNALACLILFPVFLFIYLKVSRNR